MYTDGVVEKLIIDDCLMFGRNMNSIYLSICQGPSPSSVPSSVYSICPYFG